MRTLIFFVFFGVLPEGLLGNCEQNHREGQPKSCVVASFKEEIAKDMSDFQNVSLQNVEAVLKGKEFQEFIAEINLKKEPSSLDSSNGPNFPAQNASDFSSLNSFSLYMFVSFSCSEKALMHLAEEAKLYGATLVLRGFKEGSYIKTAKSLQKIIQKTGQGVIIDPELFTLFAVKAVPTFVLSKPFPLLTTDRVQTPVHDRVQGNVSLHYALELFSREGDLEGDAKKILAQRGLP